MNFLSALKKHFGYTAFRPLQEEIVRDALAGRDVFALMPTGGGKSLCFQLPGLVARWPNDRGFAPHLAHERPGRRPPGERRGGDIFEFRARWDAGPLTAARALQRGVPPALRRAGAAHARFVHREGERVERRADRDRRSALHQRMGPRFPTGISRAGQAAVALA